MEQRPALVGGTPSASPSSLDVTNPYSGAIVARVARADADDVDRACREAAEALERPGSFPADQRAAVLDRAAMLVASRSDELAWLVASEVGKPLRAAEHEVARCSDTLRLSAAAARSLGGDVVPMGACPNGAGRFRFTLRVPIGVVGAISPFNSPLNLVAHKVGPALAAGCPVVVKPAEEAPTSALALGDLLVEAGLPSPWLSILPGHGEPTGAALVEHDAPAVISFTGSSTVGWSIRARAPRKKVLLELGSGAMLVVEPDADVDEAAAAAVKGAFAYSGQSCVSTQRIHVHERIADAFVDRVVTLTERLVVGDPLSRETDIGPVIDEDAAIRIERWIDEAASSTEVAVGGGRNGTLVEPTVLIESSADGRCDTAELFGPVVTIHRYADFDELLLKMSRTPTRAYAGIFTNRLDRALAAAGRLAFSGVLINEVPSSRADQRSCWEGGDSGDPREGPSDTVRELTEHRSVLLTKAPHG